MGPGPLGVLGGLGPAAGASFLADLAAAVGAERDQDHPTVFLLSDPAVPDRSAAILAGSAAPQAPILAGLQTLIGWGAKLLAVPCNSAHVFIEPRLAELSVPLVHIADATLRATADAGFERAWLLATRGTIQSGLYQRRVAAFGVDVVSPAEAEQAEIDAVIRAVKAGSLTVAADIMDGLAGRLSAIADLPLIAACTEIPLVTTQIQRGGAPVISSSTALARACANLLLDRDISPNRGPAGPDDSAPSSL